ncbi:MAG: hypothetical protein HYV63_06870 [Candidatus Schekmanbacteria bacterium]|nr:hypothetical protein [Candidatus Schekmanbacteria bacterium]
MDRTGKRRGPYWALIESWAVWVVAFPLALAAAPRSPALLLAIALGGLAICAYSLQRQMIAAWVVRVPLALNTGIAVLFAVLLRGLDVAWFHLPLNVALLGVAAWLGLEVGGRIAQREHLVPLLIVVSAVDTWSVYRGVSAGLVSSGKIAYFLPSLPLAPEAWLPIIGVGDLCVVAIILAAGRSLGLPSWRGAAALWIGLGLARAVAHAVAAPLPALPVSAPIYYLALRRELPLSRRDLAIALAFLAVLGAVLVVMRAIAR